MRKRFFIYLVVAALALPAALPAVGRAGQRGGSWATAGVREALRIGAQNAVSRTGRRDGFWGNLAIRILLPKELRPVERGLRAVGQDALVDEFVLSMNRAAERAAPYALDIFVDAVAEMTIDDAVGIVRGGETAATDYFRAKTEERLARAFRPVVEDSMEKVGATRRYKELTGQLPFFGRGSKLDLDGYVVSRALDGLFHVLGEEEAKIRRDPAARVTQILRDVFGP
jgi:hypothetical protein